MKSIVSTYFPCRDYYVAMSEGTEKVEKYTEIMSFDLFYKHFVFNIDEGGYREKVLKDNLQVRLVINLECGDMLD